MSGFQLRPERTNGATTKTSIRWAIPSGFLRECRLKRNRRSTGFLVIKTILRRHSRSYIYNMNVGRKAAITMLLGLFSLCGCNTRENTVVVLDEQWSVKQAEVDCQSRSREGVPPCTDDPGHMIKDLEAQTSEAFQANAACRGMTLVTLNVSDHPSQLSSRHTWWLFLELMRSNIPGELRYTVSKTQDSRRSGSTTASGQGKPNSIVGEFCGFVLEGGIVE